MMNSEATVSEAPVSNWNLGPMKPKPRFLGEYGDICSCGKLWDNDVFLTFETQLYVVTRDVLKHTM